MRKKKSSRSGGNCFMTAQRVAEKIGHGALVCHGMVTSQKLGRHLHAWVEREGLVIDHSNGCKCELPAFVYYRLGQIDEAEVRRYDRKQVRGFLLAQEHYGPWEEVS